MRCVFENFANLCDYVLNLTCFEQEKIQPFFGSLNYCKTERKKRPKSDLIKFAHLCEYVLNLDMF